MPLCLSERIIPAAPEASRAPADLHPRGKDASRAPIPTGPHPLRSCSRTRREWDTQGSRKGTRVETSGGIQASLSGRYATALFDLAREQTALGPVEASLAAVRQALSDSADFRALTVSPLIGRADAGRAIAAVAQALDLDKITTNFLGVLAANGRLRDLPAIIKTFAALAARHRGETTAEVVSAHPLAADQVDAIRQQLRARVGRDVNVELSVDPSLLGGLVVRIGSQMIDSSIKTRLNTLAHAMKG